MTNNSRIKAINRWDIKRRKINTSSRIYFKDFIKILPIFNEYVNHIMSEDKPRRIINSNIYR